MRSKSLSKLIKELGDNFLQLSKYSTHHSKKGMWQAGGVTKEGYQWIPRADGNTPEEAVKNLLNKLNEK